MKIIESFLKKLKALFSFKKNKLSSSNYIGSVNFILNNDLDIDIKISLPNIKNIEIEELTGLSEKYGLFLNNITDGSLSDTVLDVLNRSKQTYKDPVQQLFIENIIFFWSILYTEKINQNKKRHKKNSPIIRPLSVFGHSQLN